MCQLSSSPFPRKRPVAVAVVVLALVTAAGACAARSAEPSPYQDARLNDVCLRRRHARLGGGRSGDRFAHGGRRKNVERADFGGALPSEFGLVSGSQDRLGGRRRRPSRIHDRGAGVVLADGERGTLLDAGEGPGAAAEERSVSPTRRAAGHLGDASPLHPTGLFFSDSGGRAWKTAAGPRGPGWLCADMVDANSGALAGRDGVTAADPPPGRHRHRHAAAWACEGSSPPGSRPARLWVADRGRWLGDDDRGRGKYVGDDAGPPAGGGRASSTGRRSPSVGRTAGSPARPVRAILLFPRRRDGRGNSSTPDHTAPIRGLSFVDDKVGWAVGDLGTILQTDRTVERPGSDRRAAARGRLCLGVFSLPRPGSRWSYVRAGFARTRDIWGS